MGPGFDSRRTQLSFCIFLVGASFVIVIDLFGAWKTPKSAYRGCVLIADRIFREASQHFLAGEPWQLSLDPGNELLSQAGA